MSSGRYSAGRIFLQVVPSFKNVQKETAREVEKVNRTMEKSMGDAAEKSGTKAGKRAGKEFGSNFTEGTLQEMAKGRIAVSRQVGKYNLDVLKQGEKLKQTWNNNLKSMFDEQAKTAEKARTDAARAEEKAGREALRLLRKQMADRYSAMEKEAKAKQRIAERAAAEAARVQAAADRQAAAQAARVARAAQKEAEAAQRAKLKIEKAGQAAIEKAEKEHMARRGGAARAILDKAIKGIGDSLGSADLSTKLGTELDKLHRKAKDVGNDVSKGLISTDVARTRLRELGREMEKLNRHSAGNTDYASRGNMKQAIREIREMDRASKALATDGNRMSQWLRGSSRDGEDGANAFRIFNYRVLAVVSALPLLVPLLAAGGAGLIAIATAALGAATGLGVLLLGFSGLGEAVKALGAVQDNAAKDTLASGKAMRNAAKGVRDAQQALARATRESAQASEDSARRIADAERRVADSQRDATKAQQALREARKQAQQEQQDLADKIAAGKLDERQALIDLFNAQVDYNAAMADGGATNLEKEQASINLGRAQLAIKNIREENAGLAAEQKKTAAEGIKGNAAVVAATERVADTTRAQQDAVRDLADARREAAQAAVDSQERIRDAQERLSDAQASYQEALTKTGEIGSGSMQKLQQAMGKLSPAGRSFALYLFGLRKQFYELRNAAQEGLLPGVQRSMETLMNRYGPGFLRFVGTMAKSMGDFFEKASTTFTSPIWATFFSMMEKMAPIFGAQFGTTFLNLLTGLVGIMTAFAPLSKDMGDSMVRLSAGFAKWGGSLAKSEGFQKFLAYIDETGPKVWKLIENIVGAFINVGTALAPIAGKLLDFAIGFFGYIADMDPDTLAAIVTAVLGFVLASQLAAGATQALITLKTPFHSAFGAIIFMIVAAGAAFLYLYKHSDRFREIVDKIVGFIREHKTVFSILAGVVLTLGGALFGAFKIMSLFVGPLRAAQLLFTGLRVAMGLLLGPVGLIILAVVAIGAALWWLFNNNKTFHDGVMKLWNGLVTGIKWLWDNVLWPTFVAVGKVIAWMYNNIAKPIFAFIADKFRIMAAVIGWIWSSVLGPVFELFIAIIRFAWEKWISPILGWIGDKFAKLGDRISYAYNRYIKPIIDAFMEVTKPLRDAWGTAIDAVGAAWDSLREKVHSPIKWIIETVINKGFVDNFNKLADVFGTSHIPHLSVPGYSTPKAPKSVGGERVNAGQFYTGGYTGPGAKYQPAGVVHADEFVIRKESTNKIRSKYGLGVLDHLNRYGDLPGMGGYASGGLVAFGRKLQEMGLNVSEHPAFGGVHPVHSKNSWHYKSGAVDVNYDGHGQAFENAKINSILGLAKQYGLRTIWQYPNHYDHAHFDIGTGADLGNFAGAGAGHKADLPWWLDKPLDFMRDAVGKLTAKAGDGILGKFLTAVPLKVLDFAAEKITQIISGTGDFDMKHNDANTPMGGVQQWKSLVLAALARVHEPSSLLDTVLRRMNQESSGDPKAINLWDSNARAGHPSKGLMQVIDSTFGTFRDKGLPNDIWNPMANVVASMRYAKSTYGSLATAFNRPGGYAEGGLVTEGGSGLADNGTMMYDNGGYLPPGLTTVLNLTGRPEPVFTADQWGDVQGGKGGGRSLVGGNLVIEAHGNDLTPGDVADELVWTLGRIEHGGKYAGVSH